jgi:predicted nucleic acid-binding protein
MHVLFDTNVLLDALLEPASRDIAVEGRLGRSEPVQ